MERELEVISICLKTGSVTKNFMKESDWLQFHKTKRKKGFIYIPYQKGFSSFLIKEEKK